MFLDSLNLIVLPWHIWISEDRSKVAHKLIPLHLAFASHLTICMFGYIQGSPEEKCYPAWCLWYSLSSSLLVCRFPFESSPLEVDISLGFGVSLYCGACLFPTWPLSQVMSTKSSIEVSNCTVAQILLYHRPWIPIGWPCCWYRPDIPSKQP